MVNPSLETVGELDAFWDRIQSPVGSDVIDSLASLVGSRRPPLDYVVIPAGIHHKELVELPLRRRTANVLEGLYARGLLTGDNDLTVGFLMSIRSFGRRSLLDLMCVAEVALALRGLEPEPGTQEPEKERETPGYPTAKWVQFVHQLDVLLAAASEFYGAGTAGEALKINLYGLASKIGIAPELDSLAIGELTKRSTTRHTVIKRIADLHRSMEPRELQVFERRLCTDNPDTLEDLGNSIGVVRQRVSQIERAVRERVEERVGVQVGILASFIGEQMPPVMDAREFDAVVTGLFPQSDEKLAAGFAIRLLRERLGYSCANGICLSHAATRVAHDIGEMAAGGDDVGLVEEQALRDQLPDETWGTYLPLIIQACGLFHFGKWVSARATVGARAKAALLKCGRLATVEEVAKISGLAASQVGVQFRKLASVARADKDRWGLREWIDDEYEGIAAEIVQRIKEDGGATSLQRLVEELPRRFGVSQSSVQIIAGTRQFSVQDGYVSMASETTIALGNFDDVVHGRTENGEPYWTFQVEARHFEGYSLTRFPAELARELGCEPNGKTRVKVRFPECCRDLSVSWRLSSPTGPSLGYLSDPLHRLGAADGDQIRVILTGSGEVELRPDTSAGSAPKARSGNSFLEAMKKRRSVSERAGG